MAMDASPSVAAGRRTIPPHRPGRRPRPRHPPRRRRRRRPRGFATAAAVSGFLAAESPNGAAPPPALASAALSSPSPATELLGLPPCELTSLELHSLGSDEAVGPCILYDVRGGGGGSGSDKGGSSADAAAGRAGRSSGSLSPPLPSRQRTSPLAGDGAPVEMAGDEGVASTDDGGSGSDDVDAGLLANRTTEVTLVQVTPALCHNHRDGGVTGVRALNSDNGGRGGAIGFYENHYVKFRFVSVVAGNHIQLGSEYSAMHEGLLESMLDILRPQYIVGTCSFEASTEKEPANKFETVVVAQVGPPGFYREDATPPSNPYVFGIHVNSDTYPIPALRSLSFHVNSRGEGGDRPAARQPIRVLYRTESEFFRSTCQTVVDEAVATGFSDTVPIAYDPDADEDGDGVVNEADVEYLEGLADEACPPGSSADDGFEPALFGCVKSDLEADTVLNRWKANGCRPALVWLTPSTWGWAGKRREEIPYFQGGGQWHKNFRYSDKFFETGEALIEHNAGVFGYTGSYDMVVCYAIPMLFYHHIASFFRIVDEPDAEGAFRTRYEEMRRALLMLNADTIFGPIRFDGDQRNVGREAAGMQWVPARISSNFDSSASASDDEDAFIQACVSPLSQAEVATVVPAPSSLACDAGSFVSNGRVVSEPSMLQEKCEACPADSFTSEPNEWMNCTLCADGSSTDGETGSTHCIQVNSNLLPLGLLLMGYMMVTINWMLALGFLTWIYKHRGDAVVKVGQREFLNLVCFGVMVSTLTIIALGVQADFGEDTSRATAACQAAPFLYSAGWVIAYSSLTAKSYRLYRMCHNPSLRRITVTARQTFRIVLAALSLDLAVLIIWQVVDPLMYKRREIGRSLNSETGTVTIETVGQCSNENGFWPFVGPLMGIHASLLIITNVLLYKVRNVAERYQEQKYIALASIYVCEILLLGLPVLVAVRDSAVAKYIALIGIVFLNDSGILCVVFIPKVLYQKEGLPEGMTVGQSIMSNRNHGRRASWSPQVDELNPRASQVFEEPRRKSHGRRGSNESQGSVEAKGNASALLERSETEGTPKTAMTDGEESTQKQEHKQGSWVEPADCVP